MSQPFSEHQLLGAPGGRGLVHALATGAAPPTSQPSQLHQRKPQPPAQTQQQQPKQQPRSLMQQQQKQHPPSQQQQKQPSPVEMQRQQQRQPSSRVQQQGPAIGVSLPHSPGLSDGEAGEGPQGVPPTRNGTQAAAQLPGATGVPAQAPERGTCEPALAARQLSGAAGAAAQPANQPQGLRTRQLEGPNSTPAATGPAAFSHPSNQPQGARKQMGREDCLPSRKCTHREGGAAAGKAGEAGASDGQEAPRGQPRGKQAKGMGTGAPQAEAAGGQVFAAGRAAKAGVRAGRQGASAKGSGSAGGAAGADGAGPAKRSPAATAEADGAGQGEPQLSLEPSAEPNSEEGSESEGLPPEVLQAETVKRVREQQEQDAQAANDPNWPVDSSVTALWCVHLLLAFC